MSTNERLRGRALQALRKRWFARFPLCVHCQQADPPRVSLATQLDHRIALTNGGTDTDDNRQGLCDECHDVKTAADLNHKPKGCDSSGWPTDPRHPWNRKP